MPHKPLPTLPPTLPRLSTRPSFTQVEEDDRCIEFIKRVLRDELLTVKCKGLRDNTRAWLEIRTWQ